VPKDPGPSGKNEQVLPPDRHIHTQWSWDAPYGDMERACRRAVQLGLRSVTFTDHADFSVKTLSPASARSVRARGYEVDGRQFRVPPLDVDGYLKCLAECQARFPALQIRSGVELGEPHRHPEQAARLLRRGRFDQVLGSVHSLPGGPDGSLDLADAYRDRPAPEVLRAYLAEVTRMIEGSGDFTVLAHIDFAARYWPAAQPYRPADFEPDYRAALSALARTGRALEVNTRLPLDPLVVRWWQDEGGTDLTFGSDAHHPEAVARGFADAAASVRAVGVRF
jgi:histidinol-phosphatase (PHP family)